MVQLEPGSQDAYVSAELREMARRAHRLSAVASSEEDRQQLCMLTGALEARAAAFDGQPSRLPRQSGQLFQFLRRVVG